MVGCINLFLVSSIFLGQLDQTDALIKDLGSDVYAIRQRASDRLVKNMDQSLYVYLKDQIIKQTEAEPKRRIEMLLREHCDSMYVLYKVDLGGYPDYPWIDMAPLDLEKEFFKQKDTYLVLMYLGKVQGMGILMTGYPDYLDRRKATEIWISERTTGLFEDCLAKAKTQKQLDDLIKEKLAPIEKDLQDMIKNEDRRWQLWEKPNPLRSNKK